MSTETKYPEKVRFNGEILTKIPVANRYQNDAGSLTDSLVSIPCEWFDRWPEQFTPIEPEPKTHQIQVAAEGVVLYAGPGWPDDTTIRIESKSLGNGITAKLEYISDVEGQPISEPIKPLWDAEELAPAVPREQEWNPAAWTDKQAAADALKMIEEFAKTAPPTKDQVFEWLAKSAIGDIHHYLHELYAMSPSITLQNAMDWIGEWARATDTDLEPEQPKQIREVIEHIVQIMKSYNSDEVTFIELESVHDMLQSVTLPRWNDEDMMAFFRQYTGRAKTDILALLNDYKNRVGKESKS